MSTIQERLRLASRYTRLDADRELLTEAADEIDRLSAAQPADVTDEQIAACVKRASTYGLPFVGLLNPGGAPSEFSKRFTAEILALRPVQVPMTDEPVGLGPLAKRNIYDAIRGAYDLGYNDARNARAVPGDSAPGYDGRSVEEDHGGALFNILSRRLKQATPEPVLFIHPDTFALNQAHVGAWKPGHELPGYIPLYTHPVPSAPADVVRDAKRYRWLAGCCRSTSEHWGGRWSIIIDGPAPKTHDSEDDLDAAIDAAMLAAKDASA